MPKLRALIVDDSSVMRKIVERSLRQAGIELTDVIMCCNVLIYFDVASKQRVIQHFYDDLLPHGYLFLGHAESLYGINDEFHLVHLPSATAYVKGEKI